MKSRRSTVTRLFPTRRDADGCPVCAVCGVRITRKDGSPAHWARRYCGEACRVDAWIRAGNTATIREEVWRRDRGLCAVCGLDCGAIDRTITGCWKLSSKARQLWHAAYDWTGRPICGEALAADAKTVWEIAVRIAKAIEAKIRERYGSPPWEADHVVPVVEGGGGCGLDGYRTLCVACHRAETAALARRLAQARRREKIARAVARYGRPPEQLGLW